MSLSINATAIKSYFQYRCERQLRYKMMKKLKLQELGIEYSSHPSAWIDFGNEFEEKVVQFLAETESVLMPEPGEKLSAESTLSFLSQNLPNRFAHQLLLQLPDQKTFSENLNFELNFNLSSGFADLVEAVTENGKTVGFRIIDIKAVQQTTIFHKIQVAYYSLILAEMLKQAHIDIPVYPYGAIWHARPTGTGNIEWEIVEFKLKGYQEQIIDFLRNVTPRVTQAAVTQTIDETSFRIYFKCEECNFLVHCQKSMASTIPTSEWELSATPGISLETKRALKLIGINSVGHLAASSNLQLLPTANWSLKNFGDVLTKRAEAIRDQKIIRFPQRYSHLMPADYYLGIFLTVDFDPIEGRIAAVGCYWQTAKQQQFCIEIVKESGQEAERDALHKVLETIIDILSKANNHNATSTSNKVTIHIFVYEPSEATDLRKALGRHLSDPGIRSGLLNMLRMFPPEDFPVEPEYKGIQHLPGAPLRSIIEHLFAMPVKVSQDLRSVSEAISNYSTSDFEFPYEPSARFYRPFSSRLNLDVCSDIKKGAITEEEVAEDVKARLLAMSSLAKWLVEENKKSDGFLRLKKQPFRWQETFNPLNATDLDLLRAQEILENRSRELETLTDLALPWEQRRERLKCFAKLQFIKYEAETSPWATRRIRFSTSLENLRIEIAPSSFGLILTNDNPDLRLDSLMWKQLFVDLIAIEEHSDELHLIIEIKKITRLWRDLLTNTTKDGWFLDQAFLDINGPKMNDFLEYLGMGDASV